MERIWSFEKGEETAVQKWLRLVCTMLLFCSISLEGAAQEPIVIVVTGSLVAQQATTTPTVIEVVVPEEKAPQTTAAQIIAEIPGVDLRANMATPGGVNTTRIWGSTASQVLILLDGIPLNSSWDGVYDLSLLPAEAIERIEVQKGGSSALYGSAAVGGVINIITKKGFTPRNDLVLGMGSWNERNLSWLSGGPINDLTYYSFHFNQHQGDGYQEHSAFAMQNYYATVTRDWSDYSTGSLTFLAHDAQYQAPPLPYGVADGGDRQLRLQGNYTYDSGNADSWQGNLWVDSNQRKYASEWENSEHKFTTLGYNLIYNQDQVAAKHSIGIDGNLVQVESSNVSGQENLANYGLFLESTGQLGAKWQYLAGGRLDKHSYFGWHYSPRVGVSTPLGKGVWKTNIGTAFKAPTALDLFWEPGGDRDLRPERSWSLETQYSQSTDALEWGVTAFYRNVLDMINWAPDDPDNLFGLWSIQNIDRVAVQGVESTLTYRPIPQLAVSGALTLLAAEGTDQAVNPLSPVEYGVKATYQPAKKWQTQLKLTGSGAAYNGREDYQVIDAQVVYAHSAQTKVSLEVKNLLDKEYQINAGYPMPGRQLSASIRYSF